MSYHCFKCNSELTLVSHGKVGRSESCPACQADLRACRNCAHYDRTAYNECRESQAERVLDKERGNFCDYFTFRAGSHSGSRAPHDARKKLDDLFK